jgi:hypothetical protein
MPSSTPPLEIIILAAGQGKRMRSDLPKVLHPIAGRPLLGHVIDTARRLSPARLCVVVGHGAATQVTEVDVASFTVRHVVPLLDVDDVPAYARDVAFFAGDATAYAVSLRRPDVSPAHGGVVLVDDGIELPDRTRVHTGPTTIAGAGQAGVLWGSNGDSSAAGFYRVERTPYGLEAQQVSSLLFRSFQRILEVDDGLTVPVYLGEGNAALVLEATQRMREYREAEKRSLPPVANFGDSMGYGGDG